MCLIVVALGQHPDLPLIIAANRDEFHARPASAAGWWTDPADILGGRDLEAGGTWLALHRSGRIAAVTNYHGGEPFAGNARSRGYLVTEFLTSGLGPLEYLESIDGSSYAGFNLLTSDGATLAYMSNRGREPVELEPGIYGLSNALLDSPWAKVERSKAGAMNTGVPASCLESVVLVVSTATPKSPIKAWPLPLRKRFSGLRSRCNTPA